MLLLPGCSSPPAVPSASRTDVDVLDYLLGDAALWPRVGSHAQHQIVISIAAKCAG